MTTVPSMAELHAFEPSPDTFSELESNIRLNGLPIVAHNVAVSDQAGTLHFGIVNRLSGANSVVDTSIHHHFERQIEVPAVQLDELLHLRGRKVCIKMDVEGHEEKAISGMANIFADNDVVLQIEDYGSGNISELSESASLKPLFRVGADRYFASKGVALTAEDMVEIFEVASAALVQSRLAELQEIYIDGEAPLEIGVGRNVRVQVRGKPASLARWLRGRSRVITENLRQHSRLGSQPL
jgi:FkbM family methyltransferase